MTADAKEPAGRLFHCPYCGFAMCGLEHEPGSRMLIVNPWEPHNRLTGEEQKETDDLIDRYQRFGIGAGAGLAGVFLGRCIIWPPSDWFWTSFQLPIVAMLIASAAFVGMGIAQSLSQGDQRRIRKKFLQEHEQVEVWEERIRALAEERIRTLAAEQERSR